MLFLFFVEISYNPYQGLKRDGLNAIIPTEIDKVEISYNPYQGLKP